VTLLHVGASYSAIAEIAAQATKDLGFKVEMQNAPHDALLNRLVTQPQSIDVADVEFFFMKQLIPRGNVLQAIDRTKFDWWGKVVPIFTEGKDLKGHEISRQGVMPYDVLYLPSADAKEFATAPTDFITGIPTVYNVDTLGVRPDIVGRPIEKWSELLNEEFKGRTALVGVPSIGIMDAAMALESRGDIKYGNKGNMTQAEIDTTIDALIAAKKAGQFRAFWNTFDESVNLMASGEVVLQSMWSPAVTAVKARDIECVYQPLKEGYRGWGSAMGLMAHLDGIKKDAAYEYLTWYQSGWQGAFIAKQGYYSAVPETAKAFLTPNEWGYWYEGKPAVEPIVDPYGTLMEKAGRVRDGGSFAERTSNIACWNSLMDENRYLVRRWNEFLAS